MVKYVEIKGKKHPVRVSYLALKMVKEDTKKDLTNMDTDNLDFDVQESLIYWALKSGHNAMKQVGGIEEPFTFTKEQMEEVLDDCWIEFVSLIPEFFEKPINTTLKENSQEVPKNEIPQG